MEEQLISFATAKLAKEKGFGISCRDRYGLKSSILYSDYGFHINDEDDTIHISAPTQSLLQKWLREKHNILLVSLPWRDHQADINDSYEFRPMIVGKKTFDCYKTYEEALEKGLQEALKLIKI